MKGFTIALIAAAGIATPAVAQTGMNAPFTGPHIELHGGWNWLRSHTHVANDAGTAYFKDTDDDGFFGGQIGYDQAFNGLTAGVFGSYDVSNNDQCQRAGPVTSCVKAKRNIEAGARVGKVLGGTNLLYVKGAYVNGRFGTAVADDATDTIVSQRENRDGWRAGIGIEHQLGQYAYVKLEYNYSDYGRYRGHFASEDFSSKINRQEALGGVGIRF